jgi:hypothetical protein
MRRPQRVNKVNNNSKLNICALYLSSFIRTTVNYVNNLCEGYFADASAMLWRRSLRLL